MVTDRREVSVLLDKLSLEMLRLMEEKVRNEIEIERLTGSGNIHIAKSRYIAGQQTVSVLQLPTENTPDFNALAKVEKNDSESEDYSVILNKPDNSSDYINPIKWFGVLVPQNLYRAQEIYQRAITYIVSCVNTQNRLINVCDNIRQLKCIKAKLTPEE